MAEAIVLGGVRSGILSASEVGVSDPTESRRSLFAEHGVVTFEPGSDIVTWANAGGLAQVMLAVKPQMLGRVVEDVGSLMRSAPRLVVVSILAGTPISSLASSFGAGHAYVRLMPNTPAQVSRGLTAMSFAPDVAPEEADLTRRLFAALGDIFELDEPMIDAFTSVAGSGPAYVFYLVEALTRAALDVGFDAMSARRLAEGTVIGSTSLLEASDEDAPTLRARVTSKGGTTAAAIETFDRGDVMGVIGRAVVAARDRGRELGRLSDG